MTVCDCVLLSTVLGIVSSRPGPALSFSYNNTAEVVVYLRYICMLHIAYYWIIIIIIDVNPSINLIKCMYKRTHISACLKI